MKQAFNFSIKVWLTTVFVAPAAIIGLQILEHNYRLTHWAAYYVAIVVGGLYSVPSAALLVLAVYFVKKNVKGQMQAKIWLSFLGLLLTLLAMALYTKGLPNKSELFYTVVYASVIVAGLWLYKLKPVENGIVIDV